MTRLDQHLLAASSQAADKPLPRYYRQAVAAARSPGGAAAWLEREVAAGRMSIYDAAERETSLWMSVAQWVKRAGVDPIYCSGYRYGRLPLTSEYTGERRSYNHRDHCAEPGVSLACLDGGEQVRSFAVFGASDRPVVRVSGWLIGTGGDDEPCLLVEE